MKKMKTLIELYESHAGKVSDKWSLYLREYDRIFQPYRDKPISLLEIGIQNGGSLEIWSEYFTNAKKIVGCDINPDCAKLKYSDPRIVVIVGDATSVEIQHQVLHQSNSFDLIIEDGSHRSGDIVKAFAKYFPALREGGLFIAEDLHCSYWQEFEGGLYDPYSSVSFFKALVDIINHQHWGVAKTRNEMLEGFNEKYEIEIQEKLLSEINSVEFINSICIVRKFESIINELGPRVISGRNELIVSGYLEKQRSGSEELTLSKYVQTENFWSCLTRSPGESYLQLEQSVSSLQKTIEAKQLELEELRHVIHVMEGSRSWRYTKLLRSIGGKARCTIKKSAHLLGDFLRSNPRVKVKITTLLRVMHIYGVALRAYRRLYPNALHIESFGIEKVTDYRGWQKEFDTPSKSVIEDWDQNKSAEKALVLVSDMINQQNLLTILATIDNSVGVEYDIHCVGRDNQINGVQFLEKGDVLQKSLIGYGYVFLITDNIVLREHGLRTFIESIEKGSSNVLLAYSDRDSIDDEGALFNPWFKPEYSELLLKQGRLLDGISILKLTQKTRYFISQIISTQHFDECKLIEFVVSLGRDACIRVPHVLYHCRFEQRAPKVLASDFLDDLPKAAVIIPTRDRLDLLGPCLNSLIETNWPNDSLEVIVVDNGSVEPQTLEYLKILNKSGRITLIRDDLEFNWSRLNNLAVSKTDASFLVFLNNDTEINDVNWLRKLAVYAMQEGVGAVGCKLLYPDRTVQHGGVIAGIQGVAGHAHLCINESDGGYCGLSNITHEVSAVTGACLAVKRKNYIDVGGFNEEFRVAFNDIAFCFSMIDFGLKNIYVSDALVIHHESKSRGFDDTPEKIAENRSEAKKIWSLYPHHMKDDKCYSPSLSLFKPYDLAFPPRRRAVWDDGKKSLKKVFLLSSTHSFGSGVAVVLSIHARSLVKNGYKVYIGGPISPNDIDYIDCVRVAVGDPVAASIFAAKNSIDLIISHTPPFYSIARWVGCFTAVVAYDYGEPPPYLFEDVESRKQILAEKDFSLLMTPKVYAISKAIEEESRTPVTGILPLGNGHLGRWADNLVLKRELLRSKLGWGDKFVILNVCRFHSAERKYKGLDNYIEIANHIFKNHSEDPGKYIFVVCGRGDATDIQYLEKKNLHVFANVTNEELNDLYIASDCYANFSKWEGYNLGIGQALAMGLPVIASDIPAHRAFNIKTTNSIEEASNWIYRCSLSECQRVAQVVEWDAAINQLLKIVRESTGG